jgi:ATP-binding cassette, subfamily B, bacterial
MSRQPISSAAAGEALQAPFPVNPFGFTWWLVRHVVPGRAATLLLITAVATGLQALAPYVLGRFVDTLEAVAAGHAQREAVTALFLLLVVAWLVGPAVGRLYTLVNAFTMPRMRAAIDTALVDWTLRQSASFFSHGFSGALTQQIRKAGQAAPNLFESFVLPFNRVAVTMAVAGVLLWTAQPVYAYAFAAFTAVFIGVSLVMARYVGRVIEKLAEARSVVSGRIADIIGGNAVVRSFGAEDFERQTLVPLVEEEYRWGRRSRVAFTVMRMAQLVLSVGFMTGLTWLALQAALDGELSTGAVAMILAIGLQLTMSITTLGDDILDSFEQVGDLRESLLALSRPRELADAPTAVALPVTAGPVMFRDVTFRYGGASRGAAVFVGISLTIEAGERVGIVGYSGAGKSTLLKLLTRQYDVDTGAVLLGGHDVRALTQASLRQCFAEVSQSTELFHRSIRDNIRYGRPSASDVEVEAAARAAFCHAFILSRAGGYDAVVGERGIKLSGGERQRIAIARAILKDAPILLLDEATASLDSESEAQIQQALNVLIQGRTVIAIAHRLSTIANMDRIVVLHHGEIAEEGTHAALLARGGRYADLWQRQHQMASDAAREQERAGPDLALRGQ